jgi:hypothetical protein
LSSPSSVTETSVLFQAGGAVASVVGAVLSILTAGALVALVEFPALSGTVAVAVRPVPSLEIVESAGQLPLIPERASEHVQWTATSLLYQPAAFGLPTGVPERLGAVLSMLTPPTACAVSVVSVVGRRGIHRWFAPSLEKVYVPLPVQLLMPDSSSEQAMLSTTFVLFQPSASAGGLLLRSRLGLSLSSLMTTEPEPVLPSRSVADEVFVMLIVFVVTLSVVGVGPLATPDAASVADQLMVTSALFQPAPFAAGERTPVTDGPVLSRM